MIIKRLKKIRQILDLNQTKFAEKLNIPSYKIKDIESGKVKLSVEIASLVEEIFSFNVRWILTGKGDMYVQNNSQETDNKSELIKSINDSLETFDVDYLEQIKKKIEREKKKDLETIELKKRLEYLEKHCKK